MALIWALILIAGMMSSLPTSAQSEAEDEDNHLFRNQVDELNERYEDFFVRESEQLRYAEELRRGIPELRLEKQKEEAEEREALRQYRLERRVKPDDSALEAEHEAEKKAAARLHERYREGFVSHRDQLRRIRESARKIPENRDAGLE